MPMRDSAADERRDGQPDRLAALLRSAYPDAAAPGGETEAWAVEVERTCRLRRSRRRWTMTAACSLAALAVMTAVVPRMASRSEGERPTAYVAAGDPAGPADVQPDAAPTPSVESDRAALPSLDEIVRLRAEADSRARVARLVSARAPRRFEPPARRVATADPVDAVRQELNQAAMTLLHQADGMARNEALVSVAAEWYRRAIDRFPDTYAAELALSRLQGISAGG